MSPVAIVVVLVIVLVAAAVGYGVMNPTPAPQPGTSAYCIANLKDIVNCGPGSPYCKSNPTATGCSVVVPQAAVDQAAASGAPTTVSGVVVPNNSPLVTNPVPGSVAYCLANPADKANCGPGSQYCVSNPGANGCVVVVPVTALPPPPPPVVVAPAPAPLPPPPPPPPPPVIVAPVVIAPAPAPAPVTLPGGIIAGAKYAFLGDVGGFMSRCAGCVSGAKYGNTVAVHVKDFHGNPWSQWTVISLGGNKVALQADDGTFIASCPSCMPGAYKQNVQSIATTKDDPNAQFVIESTTTASVWGGAPSTPIAFKNVATGTYLSRCNGCYSTVSTLGGNLVDIHSAAVDGPWVKWFAFPV